MDFSDLVRQLREQFPPDTNSAASLFNFVRRVAWALKDQGFGLMEKSYGGEDEFEYQGTKYSLKRIATVDRHYKILSDGGVGGTNGATWSDEGPLPDRPGVSFKPALPPDDAPAQGSSSQPHGTLDEAVMALARAQAAELIDESLKPLVAALNALAAQVGQRAALPTKLALRDVRGQYLCADQDYSRNVPILANRQSRGSWETFDIEWIE